MKEKMNQLSFAQPARTFPQTNHIQLTSFADEKDPNHGAKKELKGGKFRSDGRFSIFHRFFEPKLGTVSTYSSFLLFLLLFLKINIVDIQCY
ncbi:hypothetical protein MUP65_01140 [Patescibacteria group bacterium]|nr:hypothetical protein [Patescibacteria group bacterium]